MKNASCGLQRKGYLLIGFALVAAADLNRHFSVQPFEKIEQLVCREAAEMPVYQMSHVGRGIEGYFQNLHSLLLWPTPIGTK